jgi:hypothetical protein
LLSPGHTRDADRSDGGVAIRVNVTNLVEGGCIISKALVASEVKPSPD